MVHAVDFPEKPPSEDYFVDTVGLIKQEDRQEINQIAGDLLSSEQVPIFVVTISSLLDYNAGHLSVERYAQELFNHWGVGSQERNYGMLLLVSLNDRKARIELGAQWGHNYDRQAQQVMDDLIIPQFKLNDYSGGILAGVRGLDAMARGLALPKPQTPWWVLPLIIVSFLLIVAVIVSLFKSGRSGWGWALIAALGLIIFFLLRNASSSSGSGGGFGGGSSGGGGASGSW